MDKLTLGCIMCCTIRLIGRGSDTLFFVHLSHLYPTFTPHLPSTLTRHLIHSYPSPLSHIYPPHPPPIPCIYPTFIHHASLHLPHIYSTFTSFLYPPLPYLHLTNTSPVLVHLHSYLPIVVNCQVHQILECLRHTPPPFFLFLFVYPSYCPYVRSLSDNSWL